VSAALEHAFRKGSKSVTIVHKGNIMKFTQKANSRNGAMRSPKESMAIKSLPGLSTTGSSLLKARMLPMQLKKLH
jgi:isocitrate dehydrogenase